MAQASADSRGCMEQELKAALGHLLAASAIDKDWSDCCTGGTPTSTSFEDRVEGTARGNKQAGRKESKIRNLTAG